MIASTWSYLVLVGTRNVRENYSVSSYAYIRPLHVLRFPLVGPSTYTTFYIGVLCNAQAIEDDVSEKLFGLNLLSYRDRSRG